MNKNSDFMESLKTSRKVFLVLWTGRRIYGLARKNVDFNAHWPKRLLFHWFIDRSHISISRKRQHEKYFLSHSPATWMNSKMQFQKNKNFDSIKAAVPISLTEFWIQNSEFRIVNCVLIWWKISLRLLHFIKIKKHKRSVLMEVLLNEKLISMWENLYWFISC